VTRPRLSRDPRSVVAIAALVAVLAIATPAFAAVLDADRVGGATVSSRPEVRSAAPDLYIPSGMLDTKDGRELWARDANARRAMASTTKIMTAVVVLERAGLDDVVTVRKTDVKVGESGMGLRVGEELTVRQLLEGMLIQSGNDAATALAVHVAGSVEGFVAMMNAKAASLDLVDTRYMNPHGLDVPGHYTTAADLTALSRYAMRDPEFQRIVKTVSTRAVTEHFTHKLENSNLMLKIYPGADGIKTGWTDEAGYCVIVSAKREGVSLVATVLGAASEEGRFGQATRLLDWGFAHYRPTQVATAGERTGNVRVSDYLERTVPTAAAESTTVAVFDLSGPVRRRIDLLPEVGAPVVQGQVLGTMSVYQGDRLLAQVPVVAAKSVPEPTVWQRLAFFFARIWRGIFGP
jgi:D-alanyl-D-alanine carboxypeptidase (penicillin-binding protein 5/6)